MKQAHKPRFLASVVGCAALLAWLQGCAGSPADEHGDSGDAALDTSADAGHDADTGADADDAADSPADADQADAVPDADASPGSSPVLPWVGRVRIEEAYVANSGPFYAEVDVELADRPSPVVHSLVATTGSCRYYRLLAPASCTPGCKPNDEYCSYVGNCEAWPKPMSAGKVSVTGLKAAVSASPGTGGWYATEADPPKDLFDAGDPIAVQAAGAELPAFQAQLKGVADMKPGWSGELTMTNGQPLALSWPVQGDGALVEVVFQFGWHGTPASDIIWCEAPEAAGGLEIPAQFIDLFPLWNGKGLIQHPSWARRVSRAVVATAAGPIEVLVSSRLGIQFLH